MLGKAAAGGAMLVGVRIFTRLSDLATVLILARILDPKSFGIVAIALSVVLVFETALDLPVHNVLLRHPNLTRSFFDTAFTLSLARGVAIGVILFALAVPFAHFYNDDKLTLLVCALSLAPIFRGLVSPRLAVYQQKLSFWRDFAIEASGKLVGSTAAITMALMSHSYWAIALGTICNPAAMAITSYIVAPYRPRFSVEKLQLFIDFLGWNSAAQIISAVNWQIERLLLGKLQSPTQLGLFTTGNDIAMIPYLAVFGPIYRPLYAAFAHYKDDLTNLRESYIRASAAVLAIGLPILAGESCVAEPIVRLVLGEKWLAAAPLVHVLALSIIPALFAMSAGPLYMALGNTKLLFKRNLLELCCKVPLVIAGAIKFGILGVIFARVTSEIVANAYCLIMVHKLIGLSFRAQLLAGWRSVLSAVGMAVVVLFSQFYLTRDVGIGQAWAQLAISVPLGAVTYVIIHQVLWLADGCPDGVESMVWQGLQTALSKSAKRKSPLTPETT